jgi:uncharacterized protein (TIGR02597 family)
MSTSINNEIFIKNSNFPCSLQPNCLPSTSLRTPKMRRIVSLICTVALLAFTSLGQAQSVATDPVGFNNLTINAKPASVRGFTLLSLDFTQPVLFQGLVPVGGVSGSPTTLTFASGTFTSGALNNNSYVEVTNGTKAGRLSQIVSNTDSSITLADDISDALTAGSSTVKVRPMWTFGTVFGATNSAGLSGGPTATGNTDIVTLFNPATGQATNYFYSTNNNRWQTGLSDATNAVIPPTAGLVIERKLGTPVTFVLAGAVKLGPTGIFIQGGTVPKNTTYVANPYPLSSVTLATSNLYTGDPTTGLAGASTASAADTLSILDSTTGIYTNYFFNTSANHWQTGLSDASNVVIPAGTAVLITRKSTSPNQHSSFIWYVPQPTMNL